MVFTPSAFAFLSFEPASLPTTTMSVSLLTLVTTRPPSASMRRCASGRRHRGEAAGQHELLPGERALRAS